VTPYLVRFGNHSIDAVRHIRAANDYFEVIREDRLADFVAHAVPVIAEGGTGYTLRKAGPNADEFARFCVGATTTAWIGEHLLRMMTPKALTAPIQLFDDFVGACCSGIYREGHARTFDQLNEDAVARGERRISVRLVVLDHRACKRAINAAGRIYQWPKAPALPLSSCRRKGECGCSYAWHPD